MLMSLAATRSCSADAPNKIMVNDISRAYFYAQATSPTFVDICYEDREDGDAEHCAELLVSMYGTRSAARNWQKCYTDVLIAAGFKRGVTNHCLFYHSDRMIRTIVHGDDFVSVASDKQFRWLDKVLKNKFEKKSCIIGPEDNDVKATRVLNRIITFTATGSTKQIRDMLKPWREI